MNSRQITQFTAKLDALLQNNTFARNDAKYGYNWQKVTKYSLILVNSLHNNPESPLYSIFCRFEEPERAQKILESWGGNIWSGKCNFHNTDSETILRQFEIFLKEL